jgi:phosphate transport system substrate-binding protein
MKKSIVLVMSLLVLAGGAFAQKIKGSDTMLPLSQKEAESFMKEGKGRVTVTGGGSGVGFTALIDGTTEIAQASRKIKMDEKLKLTEAGVPYKEVIAAYDALAVVVNPSNGVSELNREQLEGIFTGKIKNWSQVGGANLQIVVYSRETSSGTYEFFREHVLKNKNFASSVLSMPATGAIIQSVSQTKGAIGYVGLAYVNHEVKALKVSFDKKNYIAPSVEAAMDKTYPITRPLYYYYATKYEAKVKAYINYVLSPEGQKIVLKVGYVPLSK